MRHSPATVFVLAALARVAFNPSSALAADAPKGGPKSCSALIVSSDDIDDTKAGGQKLFRAARILDVKVRAVIPASVDFGVGDLVTFRFLTPNGSLYQSIDVPVASSSRGAEKERRLHGYPFPLPVQRPKDLKVNGSPAQTVETRLPVGGTAIMEAGLYGTWTVQGAVGASRPCSATFEIQP